MTLSMERGSNACMGASFDLDTGHSYIDFFLSRNFKDLPQIVGLFYLEIGLAFNK